MMHSLGGVLAAIDIGEVDPAGLQNSLWRNMLFDTSTNQVSLRTMGQVSSIVYSYAVLQCSHSSVSITQTHLHFTLELQGK